MVNNLNWIASFLKSFDLFGESFTFKVKKKKYYTSLMGGITSFAFIIYSLYYLIYNLSDFFSKNIRTSEKETKLNNQNSVSLKDHQYLIFFSCLRDSNMKIDKFLLNNLRIESNYVSNKFNNSVFNITSSKLNSEYCTEEEFNNNFNKNNYNYEDFSGCMCLNFTSQYNIQDNYELRSDNFYAEKKNFQINFKSNTYYNII